MNDLKWKQAVLHECMRIESGWHEDNPELTIKEIIDWHYQEASAVSDTTKILADNYIALTCGLENAKFLEIVSMFEVMRTTLIKIADASKLPSNGDPGIIRQEAILALNRIKK